MDLEREDSKGSPYPRFKSGDSRSNRDDYERGLSPPRVLCVSSVSPSLCPKLESIYHVDSCFMSLSEVLSSINRGGG